MSNEIGFISVTSFAKKLGRSPAYYFRLKKMAKYDMIFNDDKSLIHYEKACERLGYPTDGSSTITNKSQSDLQKKLHQVKKGKVIEPKIVKEKSPTTKIVKPKKPKDDEIDFNNFDEEKNYKDLLEQIMDVVNNPNKTMKWEDLQNLESKGKILKVYYASQKEKINHEKELGQLVNRETIERILAFTVSTIRTNLINLPNNYAVALEGKNKLSIKDYVEEDINRILSELQKVGENFDELLEQENNKPRLGRPKK